MELGPDVEQSFNVHVLDLKSLI